MNVIDYITITCNKKKSDYRLHPITWKNVIDYNWLRLQLWLPHVWDHPRIISAKFGWDWLSSFRGEDFLKISSSLFSIFSLVAILVGSRDHRTQFWKGATQGPFHQTLVQIGPVVLEELIKMQLEAPRSLYSLPGYNISQ